MIRIVAWAFVLSWGVIACGASTGLRSDDAGRDAGVDRPSAITHQPFERCAVGEACGGGTTCLPARLTANGVAARLCTLECAGGSACPNEGTHSTFPVGCVTDTPTTGGGQCYEVCEDDTNCGPGTRCVVHAGLAFQLCLPVGVGP